MVCSRILEPLFTGTAYYRQRNSYDMHARKKDIQTNYICGSTSNSDTDCVAARTSSFCLLAECVLTFNKAKTASIIYCLVVDIAARAG